MPDTWFSGTTQYLYGNLSQPFQVTASRAPDNTLTVYYYDDYGALYALERGGVRYYVGSDHLGTPKVITDNTGTIVRQMEYDSWGVKISDTNAGFDLPVGFAGGIPDDATGLVRFGLRDYEPGTGRWAAKDPIFFRGGQWNLYAYVRNSPINRKDRSGLASCNYYFQYPPTSEDLVREEGEDALNAAGLAKSADDATEEAKEIIDKTLNSRLSDIPDAIPPGTKSGFWPADISLTIYSIGKFIWNKIWH